MKIEKIVEEIVERKKVVEKFICDECENEIKISFLPEDWCHISYYSSDGYDVYRDDDIHVCSPKCFINTCSHLINHESINIETNGKFVKNLIEYKQ